MTKKFYVFFSLILFFTQTGYAQIRWQIRPYQAVGYASNILLSPPTLANPGVDTIGKFAIYKRDLFNKIGLNNRLEKVDSSGGLFGVNTSLQSVNYATVSDVDNYIIKNSIDYKFKVTCKTP